MKINFYTPHNGIPTCWAESYIAWGLTDALKRLGHEIEIFDRRDLTFLNGPKLKTIEGDVFISHIEEFIPKYKNPRTKYIYWVHNKNPIPSGFDAYLSARNETWSEKIKKIFNKPVFKLELATDLNRFKPMQKEKTIEISYCGNKLSKDFVRYLIPAMDFGLQIYGFQPCYEDDILLANYFKGLAGPEDLPELYNKSKINLHFDCIEDFRMNMMTTRPFDVWACNGLLFSNNHPWMKRRGAPFVNMDIEDLRGLFKRCLDHYDEFEKIAKQGRKFIIKNELTWDKRAKQLEGYLKEL